MKHFRSGFRVLTLCCALLLCTITASAAHSGRQDLPKLTKLEIIELLQNPDLLAPDNYYVEEPSITAPHTAGSMRQELLDSGLQRLNAVRRLAGLGSVTMNEDLNVLAQKGSVVLAAGNQFTHYPEKPADMDQAFFEDAAAATAHSNLSYHGHSTTTSGTHFLPDFLSWSIDGYMSDSDVSNLQVLGHRRWMIDPRLTQVGMGAAHSYYLQQDESGRVFYCTDLYSATYWDVDWDIEADYDFISWPASGLFPTSNFILDMTQSDAWSVALNPNRYQTPDESRVTVTLSGGGKSWTFDDSQSYTVADTGLYFSVSSEGCGEGAAIIFRPDGIEAYDGVYTVTIDGLKTIRGADTTLEYTVEFFTPTCLDGHSFTVVDGDATCTAPGTGTRVCSLCGKEEHGPIPALGHQWGKGTSLGNESHTVTCTRPGCGEEATFPHDKQYQTVDGQTFCTCTGCDLYTVRSPLYWSEPGQLEWDSMVGAVEYAVILLDEDGQRFCANLTYDNSMSIESLMGWYLGNESKTLRVTVEPRDAEGRKMSVMDFGLTVHADVSPEILPYSCSPAGSDLYSLVIKHPIASDDVLLETWGNGERRTSCSRTYFSGDLAMYISSQRYMLNEFHEARLLSDSRLVKGTDWHFTITTSVPRSAEDIINGPADVEKPLESLPGSPVTGSCLIGPGIDQKMSAFVVLQNTTAHTVTANVFVAEFDAQNKMLGCGIRQLELASGREAGAIVHAEHADTVKLQVFVLDPAFSAMTGSIPADL